MSQDNTKQNGGDQQSQQTPQSTPAQPAPPPPPYERPKPTVMPGPPERRHDGHDPSGR